MARPQKQTVDYFPHDAKASEGDTLTILQSRFGNDGYAFWFKLLEKISSSENHVINCRNPAKWQLLLAKTSVNEERGGAIMDLLCELEAIDPQLWHEHKIIWCQNLVNNIADVYKGRNRPVPERPVSTTNNPVSSKETPVSTTDNTQSKVKESKLNYIIIVIFKLWNKQKIIVHKKLTDDIKSAIGRALKEHSHEEISEAIKNYAEILKGEQYYFKYSWTLKDFLKRGLEKFLDLEIAKKNYGGRDGTHRGHTGARKLPKTYRDPEEIFGEQDG